MKRFKTTSTNNIGDKKYPIYLLVVDDDKVTWKDGKYNLECEHEIYGLAWMTVYEKSVREYEEGKLDETSS